MTHALNMNADETAALVRAIDGDGVKLLNLRREDSLGNPFPGGFLAATVDYGDTTELLLIGETGATTIAAHGRSV